MGEKAYAILRAVSEYNGKSIRYSCHCFEANEKIQIGDMTIRPFLVDHSAFDAYMFLIEGEGETLLYTGDFRANGRKSFDRLLSRVPSSVDMLLCEGTTLNRPTKKNTTESELEDAAAAILKRKSGPAFVLQAATNIDRLVTMYRAAKKTGRLFLEELYMAEIAVAAGKNIPNPNDFEDVRVFIHQAYGNEHPKYRKLLDYGSKRIGRKQIEKESFVMCVRSSMWRYIQKMSEGIDLSDSVLIYSMWEGYKEKPEMQIFLEGCKKLGMEIVDLHTSGHADQATIEKLIESVNPKQILPIHTENPCWFDQFH